MCGGACVCWLSRTQKCVTVAASETEYVALGDAVEKLLFLRQVVWRSMLHGEVMPCSPVFEDNQDAVLQHVENPVTNSNSKHVDVCMLPFSSRNCSPEGHYGSAGSLWNFNMWILTEALPSDLFVFHRTNNEFEVIFFLKGW